MGNRCVGSLVVYTVTLCPRALFGDRNCDEGLMLQYCRTVDVHGSFGTNEADKGLELEVLVVEVSVCFASESTWVEPPVVLNCTVLTLCTHNIICVLP